MINNWQKIQLGDLIQLEYGKGLPESKRINGNIPVYGSNGIVGYHNQSAIKGKGIIVGRKGTIGHIEWVENDFWPIDTTYYIQDSNKYDLKWLYYVLKSLNLKSLNRATGVPGLNRKDVYESTILLPNFITQQKIARYLNIVDNAIENSDQVIQKTEVLKKGLMQDLLEKGSNHSIYKLREITDITSSKRVMVSDYVENGIPFYRSTEIIKKSKNIPLDNMLYISSEKFSSFKERFGAPKAGDILVSAVGTIGIIYLVQNETFYFKDGNLLWIRNIKSNVLPEYLKMLLSSKFYYDKLNQIAGGSTQKALTIEKMGMVEVFIPPIAEQKKLIGILSSIDNKQIYNTKQFNNLTQLRKGLMQDIFSQKVQIN